MNKRILILKLGALGDILMSTPAINAICREHEKDEVFLFTSTNFLPVFKDWPDIHVIGVPRKGLTASLKTIARIRKNRFDRIYDLQSNDRSRLYCIFSGSKEVVGNHNIYPYTIHPGDSYHGQCHIAEWHQKVLRRAGIETEDNTPWLPETEEGRNRVRNWLSQQGLEGEKLVLIHAGASPGRPEKRWPYFQELLRMLFRLRWKCKRK